MAIERCPECGEPAQSCLPADPFPQVVPQVYSCLCRNGHLWTPGVPYEAEHSDGPGEA